MADNSEQIHFALLKALGMGLGIIPAFFGVAWGLREAAVGICNSAEIRLELSAAILPMAFTCASIVYSILAFFILKKRTVDDYTSGFDLVVAGAINGMGGMLASYAVGGVARVACVTKAQQKKFSTQFFLLLIFAELIAVFALIMMILYNS